MSNSSLHDGRRGSVLSSEVLLRLSVPEVITCIEELNLSMSIRYPVIVSRIIYETITPEGQPTKASGLVVMPDEISGTLPIISYQHGTQTSKDDVPSVIGMHPFAVGSASTGYAVCVPDYLGLGAAQNESSHRLHPFLHSKSLATTVIDMLRATKAACTKNGTASNGQLFLMGYSEGGYATMAAQREIEQHYQDEFSVTASAPMAGPYDLSGVMVERILADQYHPSPAYLPYLLLAYNQVYKIFPDIRDIFAPPFDRVVPELFDGCKMLDEINSALPAIPLQMLRKDFLHDFLERADHPLRLALRQN
ncbi:MAG: hypothetical protein HGB19_06055, partial [Chlorobiales bacterium]|nr:hypothetical protein [Chlorobiales bacterium]